jgi:hypothetical protein
VLQVLSIIKSKMNSPVLTMGWRVHDLSAVTFVPRKSLVGFGVLASLIGPGRVGRFDSEGPGENIRFYGEAMRKGLWKLIGGMPALALAVAVGPAAMADGPMQNGYPADVGAAGASAIPVVDMHAFRPIQPIAADSTSYDTNYTPAPAAPVAPVAPAAPVAPCAQTGVCTPSCYCGPDGGCTFQWAPDKWCNIGAGIRTSFNSLDGHEVTDKNYFAVDEARLFFTGKVTKVIGFELNTDISGAGGQGFSDSGGDRVNLPDSIHLLDAIVKFEFSDYVNIWMGRMLTPSDRSNLSGPFFINGWDYPFVSNYPSVFEGRDDGIAYWGQYGGGLLKWQAGVFNGQGRFGAGDDWPLGNPSTSPNTNGNPEFAMRVVANLLDPEPGYYNASTYFGQRNIAAIGFALMDQADAMADSNGRVGSFLGWNFDFLLENKMTAWGSGTFEAAYYHYEVGGNVAQDVAGNAYLLFAGWLLPQPIGCCGFCGRIRPWARYQNYTYDDQTVAGDDHAPVREWDLGFDYVICGHNAKFTSFWGERKDACGCQESIIRTGVQLIF